MGDGVISNSHRVRSWRIRARRASPRAAAASSDCLISVTRADRAAYSLASMASIASMGGVRGLADLGLRRGVVPLGPPGERNAEDSDLVVRDGHGVSHHLLRSGCERAR